MNIRVLRKLAWFALPLATLCVSCGEDDDTSWKDRLEAIEQSNAALESTLSTVSSQISEGEFVTKVEFNDAGQLVITTNKTTMSPIDIPSEAVQLEVVPFIDEDGKLNVKTVCNGEECPLPAPIDLGEENAIPEFKLAEKDGEIILTMDGEVVEGSGVTMPTGVDVSDVTLEVTTDGRLVMTYGDGQEAEVKLPEGAAYELPAIELKPNGEGVVELWIDGKKVDDATIELPAVEKDKFATVIENGNKFTISTYNATTGAVETYELTKVPVVISSISLIGKYVNDAGVPQETTPVPYLTYYQCMDNEAPTYELLPGVSSTDYQVNPKGVALDNALSTVAYMLDDAQDLSTVGVSDGGQLHFDVYGTPVYEGGVLTVSHKIDYNAIEDADTKYPDAYWNFMSGEDYEEYDPIATLKINDPSLDKEVYAEDHGLFKVPYTEPTIRQVEVTPALAKYFPESSVYRHNNDVTNSGSDFVVPCGGELDLNTMVDGIAHRVNGYSQQEGTHGNGFLADMDEEFVYFSDDKLNIQSEDYEFEWQIASLDDIKEALPLDLMPDYWKNIYTEILDNEYNADWDEFFSLDSKTGVLKSTAKTASAYNKIWVKVRMFDVEDGVKKQITLNDGSLFPGDLKFADHFDDMHENYSSEDHEWVHRLIRRGTNCDWMYFEVLTCPNYTTKQIVVEYEQDVKFTYYDYYKDIKNVNNIENNNHQGTAVSLNAFQTTGMFDFHKVINEVGAQFEDVDHPMKSTIDFVDLYGVDGVRDGLLLPRSIKLYDPSGVVMADFLTFEDESTNSPDWSAPYGAYNGFAVFSEEDEKGEGQSSYPFRWGHLDNENEPTMACHFQQVIPGMPLIGSGVDDFVDGDGLVKTDLSILEKDILTWELGWDGNPTDVASVLVPKVELDFICDEDMDINDGGLQDFKITLPTCLPEGKYVLEFAFGAPTAPEVLVKATLNVTREDLELPKEAPYWVDGFVADAGIIKGLNGVMNYQIEDNGFYYATNDIMDAYNVNGFRAGSQYPELLPSERDYLVAKINGTTPANQHGVDIAVYIDSDADGVEETNEIIGGETQFISGGPALNPAVYEDYSAYDEALALVSWEERYSYWRGTIKKSNPKNADDIALVDADDVELYIYPKGSAYYQDDFFMPYLAAASNKYAIIPAGLDYDMIVDASIIDPWGIDYALDTDIVGVRFHDPFSDVKLYTPEGTESDKFDLYDDVSGNQFVLSGMVGVFARYDMGVAVNEPVIRPNVKFADDLTAWDTDADYVKYIKSAAGAKDRTKYYSAAYYYSENGSLIESKLNSYTESWTEYFLPLEDGRPLYGLVKADMTVKDAVKRTSTTPVITFAFDTSDAQTKKWVDEGRVYFMWQSIPNRSEGGELRLVYDLSQGKLTEAVDIKVQACIDHNWAVGKDGKEAGAWGKLCSDIITFTVNPTVQAGE